MRRSKTQIFLFIVVIQLISLALANGVSTVLSVSQIHGEIAEGFLRQRLTALDLAKRTELSASEIISTLSLSVYPMRIVEPDKVAFTEEQWAQLQRGESVDTWGRGYGGSYFLLRDDLIAIEPKAYYTMFISAAFRGFFNNLILTSIVILSFFLGAKRMVHSVVSLSEATRQIAAGNFDVRVPVGKKKGFIRPTVEETEMAKNFNRMAEELKGIEYLRRNFTSDVSHEIKTPIASISGYAQLLENRDLSEGERREYVEAIRAATKKLTSLSDNLLKLTKLESQQIRPPDKRFFLDEQLRRTVGELYPEIERKGIRITSNLPKTAVTADEELFEQVWQNLLDNAVKFTPEGGSVHLSIEKSEKSVTVRVEDSGIGIEAHALSRIYEKFFQADISHKSGGNGLGLPLVKRIVDIYGGSIDVKSAPGQGTVFSVSLSRAKGT